MGTSGMILPRGSILRLCKLLSYFFRCSSTFCVILLMCVYVLFFRY